MTNEEKQQQKELASTVRRETARFNDRTCQPSLSEEEKAAIKTFPEMLDKKFRNMVDSGTYSSKEMYELLYPYISAPCHVSRIGIDKASGMSDIRHINLKQMAAMRRVFGISIDQILDECFRSLPDREPPKK